jgi:predicted O-methyltransferase YrrM
MNRLERIVWLGVALRRIRDFRYGTGWGAFHCDAIYCKLMIDLLDAFHFTSFVETGTFRGYSTELMARHKPQLPVFTVEVEPCTYKLAKRVLSQYPNITQFLGNSGEQIREMIREQRLGGFPLFFLDAHWQRYWPLRDELRHMVEAKLSTVIVIDDFEVPGRPEFGFDIDGGADIVEGLKCNLDYIRPSLSSSNAYHAFYPKYSQPDANIWWRQGSLRGHLVLFQNAPEAYEACCRRLVFEKYYQAIGPVMPAVDATGSKP